MDKQIVNRFYYLTESMRKIAFNNCNNYRDISKGEFTMLHLVKICEGKFDIVTTAELSNLLNISKPAVSQMINALEEKKCVKREINKKDRRLVSITMTDFGNKKLEEEKANFLSKINCILDKMGKEDSEKFVGLMEKYFKISQEIHKK